MIKKIQLKQTKTQVGIYNTVLVAGFVAGNNVG